MAKYLFILVLCLGLSSAKSFLNGVTGIANIFSQVANATGIGDPFGIESKIKKGLLELKTLAQNGDRRLNLPPLDPFTFSSHNFHLNDSENEVNGSFNNITVRGHSNYDAVLNQFQFFPQPKVNLSVIWPSIEATGTYNLSGYVFGNNSINGSGEFEARLKGLKIMSEVQATLINSWLQITKINISYQIQHLWINYTDSSDNSTKILNETLILGLADEAEHKYFPELLNGLQDLTNSFLIRFNYRTLLSLISSFI